MTDTFWNDMVYTDMIQSDGFVVDYAVCTTYSLDMSALLSVPFMLGTMSDISESCMHSPYLMLEAINRASGKFAVFCNAGCIYVPQNNTKVYSLLERSVVQVSLGSKKTGFVNFHPKIWVIKETNPDSKVQQIKVVVMSRNLTHSNDLDVACELVGTIGSKISTRKAQSKHQPLVDFLSWLVSRANDRNVRKNIRNIIEDIQHIESFDLSDSPFEDYDFFPMGISGYDGKTNCLNDNMLDHAAEMVLISPFIDSKILEQFAGCCPKAKKTLITRHESLTQKILSMFNENDGVYVPKEVLTDKVEKDVTVDLHEKVYFIRNYQTCLNQLFLGSTNATMNGFDRNVEFLLKLTYKPYKTSYDKYRLDLIYESSDCMFEKVTSISNEEKRQIDISNELKLRQAISAIRKAQVTACDERYCVDIQCVVNGLGDDPVYLYPFGCEDKKILVGADMQFTELELSMLTEFYVIGIGDLKRLIKIDTIGMPAEERDKAIFRSYINTKSKFISYLAYMLSDDVQQVLVENGQWEHELNGKSNASVEQELCSSLYENMVRLAYRQPERIVAIRKIIEKADKSVMPEYFNEMYATFENAIKQMKNYER